jgi:hypothetical protein
VTRYEEPNVGTGVDIDTAQVTDPETGTPTNRQRVFVVTEDGVELEVSSSSLGGKLDVISTKLSGEYETRLAYDSNKNPEYVGKAAQGALASDASWTIKKLTFESSGLLVRVQVLASIAWDDREGSF